MQNNEGLAFEQMQPTWAKHRQNARIKLYSWTPKRKSIKRNTPLPRKNHSTKRKQSEYGHTPSEYQSKTSSKESRA